MRPERMPTSLAALLLSGLLSIAGSAHADPTEGVAVYKKWCDGCHMDSPFAPGTIQLRHLRGDDYALVENRENLTAEYLRLLVRKGMKGMPLFRRTEISESELDALIRYLVDF
jgi:mono/diheme cytochrome c family protein